MSSFFFSSLFFRFFLIYPRFIFLLPRLFPSSFCSCFVRFFHVFFCSTSFLWLLLRVLSFPLFFCVCLSLLSSSVGVLRLLLLLLHWSCLQYAFFIFIFFFSTSVFLAVPRLFVFSLLIFFSLFPRLFPRLLTFCCSLSWHSLSLFICTFCVFYFPGLVLLASLSSFFLQLWQVLWRLLRVFCLPRLFRVLVFFF